MAQVNNLNDPKYEFGSKLVKRFGFDESYDKKDIIKGIYELQSLGTGIISRMKAEIVFRAKHPYNEIVQLNQNGTPKPIELRNVFGDKCVRFTQSDSEKYRLTEVSDTVFIPLVQLHPERPY